MVGRKYTGNPVCKIFFILYNKINKKCYYHHHHSILERKNINQTPCIFFLDTYHRKTVKQQVFLSCGVFLSDKTKQNKKPTLQFLVRKLLLLIVWIRTMLNLVTKKVLFSAKQLLNKNHNMFPSKNCMLCAESRVLLLLSDLRIHPGHKDEKPPSLRIQNSIPNLFIFQKLLKKPQTYNDKDLKNKGALIRRLHQRPWAIPSFTAWTGNFIFLSTQHWVTEISLWYSESHANFLPYH